MIRILTLLVTSLLLWGCQTEQHFVFNADYSGQFTHSVDFSLSNEMFDDSTLMNTEELLDSLSQSGIRNELRNISGISEVELTESDNQIKLSLAFANIEALNKVLTNKAVGHDDIDQFCTFKQRGQKVIVKFDTSDLENKNKKEESDDSTSLFDFSEDEFEQLFSYRFSFTFEKGIASFKGTPATLTDDGKTLIVEETLQTLSSDKFKDKLVIKLKK